MNISAYETIERVANAHRHMVLYNHEYVYCSVCGKIAHMADPRVMEAEGD